MMIVKSKAARRNLRPARTKKRNLPPTFRPTVAAQTTFRNLDSFRKESNNFFLYFIGYGSFTSSMYRKKPVFLRFKQHFPEMEKRLTAKVTAASRLLSAGGKDKRPWAELLDAYNKMRKMLFTTDEYVVNDGRVDKYFLIR